MDRIHSTFQASFNARIERLQEQETNELRTIFRYFDTDGDGAVSADQVLRIFGLLGLAINPAYVRDLEEVYLAEFLKIVDSHVPVATTTTGADQGGGVAPSGAPSTIVPMLATAAMSTGARATDAAAPVTPSPEEDEAAQERANAQLWEDEWRILDSYGRGVISRDEFRLFLRSCFSPFPVHDLDRFLELYADPSMPEDSMMLTKASFLKFRRDYTARARAQSEHNGDTTDDENEGDEDAAEAGTVDLALVDQTLRGSAAPGDANGDDPQAHDADTKVARMKRGEPAHDGSGGPVHGGDGDVDGIVIDPGVMDDDFVDDDDGGGAVGSVSGDHDDGGGGDDDGAFYGEDDEGENDEDADE